VLSLCGLTTYSLFYITGQPTELPDSLEDAAEIAALSTSEFAQASGPLARCRVDFDTSAGDETFTLLKSSTEFMQNYVSALCNALIPGLMEQRQAEIMAVSKATMELKAIADIEDSELSDEDAEKKQQLEQIVAKGGRDPTKQWEGPVARIYFPDEGSAALARRDWSDLVPPCVQYSSCGGVQTQDMTNDEIVFFFCPKASESDYVEELLQKSEETAANLKMTVFVNPNLVDMGVTGFGMAGRLLRERLIDNLVNTYYLRTLTWGALTRRWPQSFSVWQEDENADGGYRLIASLDRLPSNPEVEDIYDIENGNKDAPSDGFGFLNAVADFANGMMKL
jgi:hypothetical protein